MKIKHVKGNVLRLEIPLTIKRKELVDGQVAENVEDFYPCPDYPTYINFKKSLTIPFEASVQGNLARMQDNGTLNVGTYQIEVMCCDEAGNPYRYMVRDIIEIVDATADADIEEGVEFNAETYTLEGAVFISYGVEQVQADWTETDIHSKAYINNKPTNLVEDESYVHTDNNYTDEEKEKLDGLENYDDSGIRQELDGKVDKEAGKGLSTNDFTNEDKSKLNSALQSETDPTVPQWAKQPNKPNYTAQEVGALPNNTKYGSTIDLAMDSATYVLTLSLKDQDGTVLNTKTVDLPIESVVVNGRYDAANKKIVLTLQSGSTIDVPVGDLIAGLQTEITSVNMLDADLVDDTNSTHKFVTAQEKQTWNNKSDFSGSYNDLTDKPSIPVVPTNVSAFSNDAGYITDDDVDDVPTANSNNLVKSGGVADGFQSVAKQLTGTISASLTKGRIDYSYQEKASNYALRTDFVDYKNLASVKVNSPYSCTFYYYNSQKVGLYHSTTFTPNGEQYSYIRVVIGDGEGRAETWENIGFELNYSNSFNGRLDVVEKNANYSQYDVILEQGGFGFAEGNKINSNIYVRTRLLTYAFIGKVTMSGSYIMYAFFYGQNKTYISYTQLTFTDGECVLPDVQNAVYVSFAIKNSDSTNIQPSDVTSVRLYPKEQEQDDFDTLKALRSYALVNILEQGGFVHATGVEVSSSKYVRTPYIPYDSLYKLSVNSGYMIHMYTYSDVDIFVAHYSLGELQEYTIPYYANIKYLRFSIQKTDTSDDITPNDNIGFNLYGLSTYREEILNEENTRNFIRANAHSLPILAGCFAPNNTQGHFGYTDFCCFAVTDLHGDWRSLIDTKSAMQYTRTNILQGAYANRPLNCVCCGDMCIGKPKQDGTVVPQVAQYMSYAQEMGIYHTMGQHEVGFYDTVDGRNKGNCFSHQEVFDYFISPMKSVWGLPNLDTIYYYKDLVDSKVRLISLYQFNIPLVDDPTDSNLYKYPRMQVWYGQDQINWFIQTLASTPSDYKVIVLMHESEAPVLPTPKKIFFTGSSIWGGNTIIDGTPIYDIVSAYIAKTTLSQTYTCINKVKYPIEDFTLSVNADFSQATGDFACFMTGDAHVDYMGVIENTTLVNIGMTATSRHTYDCTTYIELKEKTAWTGNNAGSSIVTCLGFCHNDRMIKVGRLGQQYSNIGDYRNYGAITY